MLPQRLDSYVTAVQSYQDGLRRRRKARWVVWNLWAILRSMVRPWDACSESFGKLVIHGNNTEY